MMRSAAKRSLGEWILDCLHGTEKAMTQRHTFLAAELCLKAQESAMRLDRRPLDAARR